MPGTLSEIPQILRFIDRFSLQLSVETQFLSFSFSLSFFPSIDTAPAVAMSELTAGTRFSLSTVPDRVGHT